MKVLSEAFARLSLSKPFNRRAALRITMVSVLLSLLSSPLAWFIERESAEEATVDLAMEESRRLLHGQQSFLAGGGEAQRQQAEQAARYLVGGLFDIAEIYDVAGKKIAEAQTEVGRLIEAVLPAHARPKGQEPGYDSLRLPDGRWALRVFVPLHSADLGRPAGYFEGVRMVPDWQREQILRSALQAALLVAFAALFCGAAIYPVVVHLSAENESKAREVLDSHISMMEALGRAVAKRDSDTGAHNYRVAWIAMRIAEEMGFREAGMQSLIAGSFLHDVGKIGISDNILLKPGRLTPEEFAVMRTHVAQGEDIVKGMGWLDGAHDVVSGHHEKWDGTGYPRQLAGEAIPLAARIFAVADVFDALCSRRPYKEPMSFEQAMAILEKDTGSHFDPGVMKVFQPMARVLYDRLAGCEESALRDLLTESVRRHFQI